MDNNKLTGGVPDGPDDAYIWEIEQQADGTKAIKNKKTAQYLTIGSYDATTKTIGLGDYSSGNGQFWEFWVIEI